MKKIILGLSALCMIAFTSCKEDATQKIDEKNVAEAAERDANSSKFPVITFDKTEHDFGEIEAKTAVETVFSYTNTGDAPLVITDIKSSCGCTVPQDWSKEPLAPGDSGSFTVKFNGSGKNKVSKTVTVTANTEKGKETVKITAFVKPDPDAVTPAKATIPQVK
ncbi:DUF1573 domain-containing protein [Hanstruepera marina]|uniref:DUF1573 domain-containing protein n=1 Tax=Hanstruepera marina TaxID=2873265 RepID=UPI001CA77C7A|nr:DUF1573 domain-containing protein [Hanstruepera marina]